jgi:Protein of unknown function (DUF4236)
MPSADKSRVLRKRAKLYAVPLHACSVAFACDRFFRSRGSQPALGKTSINGTQQRNQKPMGWKFRKRIRIVKGLWIDLSKRGGSLSVGGHGPDGQHLKEGRARDHRASGKRD